jgi:mannosyltransferase
MFGRRTALVSALLLAISPLHIWYSQEARMYVLVAGLGLCSAYSMRIALREGRAMHWLAYVCSTALLMNTHYFAVFLVPFQNAYVLYWLLRSRPPAGLVWRWLGSQAAVGLLSAVGLAGIVSAESGYWWGVLDTWHGAPGIADLLGVMFAFSLGSTLQGRLVYWGALCLFGSCILWGVYTTVRGWKTARLVSNSIDRGAEVDGLVFARLYLLVPVGLVFVFSQFQSFWVLRYIFPFLPPYCLLVGLGISRLRDWMAVCAVGLILVLSVQPVANMYQYEQKENWRQAAEHIAANGQSGDLVILVDEDVWIPFEHYYRGRLRTVGISRAMADRSLIAARVAALLPGHKRVWLVLSHTDNLMVEDHLRACEQTEPVTESSFTAVRVVLFAVNLNDVAVLHPTANPQYL